MSEPAKKLDDEDAGLQQRRAPRDEVALPTRMLDAERRAADVLLVNISPLGFMVREYGTTQKGAVVRLVLPRLGELEATVVWSLGGRIGAEFKKEIDPYAYAAMLNAARSSRQRWPMG
jgi:hypothetical protein